MEVVPVRHLYIHVPFCSGRCGYCAFVSGLPVQSPAIYVEAVLAEAVRSRAMLSMPLETIYCGGGTPTLLGAEGFHRLAVSGAFRLVPGGEWTVEAHPATVTPKLLAALVQAGVTRLSIGVQSFDEKPLQLCNRRHSVRQALEAIACAQQFFSDVGIDLIAGLPMVSSSVWRDTVEQAVALGLQHVSVYALSIDSGSVWHKQGMTEPDSDCVCDAVAWAAERLLQAGFVRYETSNYARPGFTCRHNLNTWHGGDYLGLGHGAASRLGALRRSGDGMEVYLEPLEDALERTLTQLRLNRGFSVSAVVSDYPVLAPYARFWQRKLEVFYHQGLLTENFAPTTRGYEVLDAMLRELTCVCI